MASDVAPLAVGQNKYGLDATALYTRSKPGEGDDRGESMVQKHALKLQQEKEKAAMQRMASLFPQLGEVTQMLVLRETDWSVEQAQVVAKQFMELHSDKLAALQKARKQLMADAAAGRLKPGGGDEVKAQETGDAPRPESGSSSSSSSGSESDGSDGDGGKAKHKHKGKKRKHKGKDKGKHKRHKKKDQDHNKAAAAPGKALTHSDNFGRFGVIRETDKAAKGNEFLRWALEVKKVNLETCGPTDERDLFKAYMEDYNTGTMPHRKYYNLEIYEREKVIKRAKKAAKEGKKVTDRHLTAQEDMEELRLQRLAERQRVEGERLAEAYKELKYKGKAQDMREQEMLRAQMALAYKTGDQGTAKALAKRLEPTVIDDRIPKKR